MGGRRVALVFALQRACGQCLNVVKVGAAIDRIDGGSILIMEALWQARAPSAHQVQTTCNALTFSMLSDRAGLLKNVLRYQLQTMLQACLGGNLWSRMFDACEQLTPG